LKISKQEAAARQIDAAVDRLFANDLVCAITLSGAAEDSLIDPTEPDQQHLFALMKQNGVLRTGSSEQSLVNDHFNVVRNWLKHDKPEPEIEIRQEDAVIMVLRAMTKFTAVYGTEAASPRMLSFEDWFRRNYSNWIEPNA
jgi:hypothetical protein